MNLLTSTLRVNATTSAATGVTLAVGAVPLSGWLGIPIWVSLFLGTGLVLFAIQVMRVAHGGRRAQVVPVIGADLAWVAGAATVILVFPESMSTSGLWALGGVTAAVGVFSALQTVGLRRSEGIACGG